MIIDAIFSTIIIIIQMLTYKDTTRSGDATIALFTRKQERNNDLKVEELLCRDKLLFPQIG
jgi:hypothetical protein